MSIKLVDDVGAPAAVAVVDIASEALKPEWNEPLMYAVTVVGYGAAVMNKGGDFAKNVGISALPGALKLVYNRVRAMTGMTARATGRSPMRTAMRTPVSSYGGRGISDVIKPEFAGVGVG